MKSAIQVTSGGGGGWIPKGSWNASTNTPAIPAAAEENRGWYYKVSVAGTTDISGITDWQIGDWVVSNGAAWEKIDQSETISAIADQTDAETAADATQANRNNQKGLTARSFRWAFDKMLTLWQTFTKGVILADNAEGSTTDGAIWRVTNRLKWRKAGVDKNILDQDDLIGLVNISQVDVTDIGVGESKLLLAKKNASNQAEFAGSVKQIDKLVSSTVMALLGDNANWGNVTGKSGDFIKLTGNNTDGQLGENSQEGYDDNGQYFLCISHVTGNPGEATWVRNRNRDALKIGVTQDNVVIAQLENETNWNAATNVKVITVRSKVGSWHKSDVTGYLYHCYNEVDTNADNTPDTWYWFRSGTPSTDTMQIIKTGNFINLCTALETHDFAVSNYDPSVLGGSDEKGKQGQEYYYVTGRNLFKCLYDGTKSVWEKIK